MSINVRYHITNVILLPRVSPNLHLIKFLHTVKGLSIQRSLLKEAVCKAGRRTAGTLNQAGKKCANIESRQVLG